MFRGLYISAASLTAEQQRVELISNNLANSATTSYKKSRAVISSFGDVFKVYQDTIATGPVEVAGVMPSNGARLVAAPLSFVQGPLRYTGDDLHVVIDGPGFYAIETPAGERYTRDGRFRIDEEGWLVNPDGFRVLGSGAPVRVPQGVVSITPEGTVTVDGQPVGIIGVVDFAAPGELVREAGNYYRASEASGAAIPVATKLASGFVEESNVNVMMEMAELIAATRAYEMNQKAIWAQDEMLGKAVNDVGRVG